MVRVLAALKDNILAFQELDFDVANDKRIATTASLLLFLAD
jgi:hypothetical protein